jgi:hypothetical protein
MITKAYNPKHTIEKKRALLEGNLYAASSLPEDLFKDAEWLDSGHVGSKLRREFTIKYLLRCAYENYILALMRFVFLYEVGKHRPQNLKKAHCYVPAQKAGSIAMAAGVNDGDWCPIVPATMAAKADANIHVLGDASVASAMPKSGFSANSQAKVAANAIRGELTGSRVYDPRFANTCWSLIATNDGVKVGASYKAGSEKIDVVDKFVSQGGEDAALRKTTYEESIGWYNGITADMFS